VVPEPDALAATPDEPQQVAAIASGCETKERIRALSGVAVGLITPAVVQMKDLTSGRSRARTGPQVKGPKIPPGGGTSRRTVLGRFQVT
jgi:hypothetical protein